MKTSILSFGLFLCLFATSWAQQFEGIATYKTDRKVDLKMEGDMDDATQASIQAQLKKQFQREYTLTFKGAESLYEEVESLEKPSPKAAAGGIQIMVSGGADVLYRNLKNNRFRTQTEIMSKPFLIKDTLQKSDWVLGKETKNIGNYTCFKATFTEEVSEQFMSSENDSIAQEKKIRTTTAWYTLDIPLGHGPSEFWGLPGLILEINDGDLTILCSKIVLNPNKPVEIDLPTTGKEVTQKEYETIQQKKMDEMMERFKGDGRRGDGQQVQIRIGG